MYIMYFYFVVYIVIYFVVLFVYFFFFKQKTAYEMRISDWSSDVCSSDLLLGKMTDMKELIRKRLGLATAGPAKAATTKETPKKIEADDGAGEAAGVDQDRKSVV